MLFSAMRFIHEPLAGIYEATQCHALSLINGLLLIVVVVVFGKNNIKQNKQKIKKIYTCL